MTVDAIQLEVLAPSAAAEPALALRPSPNEATPTFEALLRGAVATLEHEVAHAQTQVQRIALGEAVPTHRVMLALEDARLSLQFALAVRTRMVEAYQDVMRMQL